jgi:tetratricopeptide (TPR) repeat protein
MWGQALFYLAAYDQAMQKFRRAYAIDSTAYGPNHSEVASRLNNIAGVLHAKGDYAGALEKYNEALKIDEAYFGRNHPNVARGLNNIAVVLKSKGDYAGALEKCNEALKIDEAYWGRNHPNVAIGLNNIAGVLRAKGDYAGALEKYNEALTIFEKFLGADHPNTQTVRENRDQAYFASLPAPQQWQLRTQRLLAIWKAPPEPLFVGDSLDLLNDLGAGYIKQSKADSALFFLHQALPIAERLKEQEMLGNLYNNLGSAYKLKQDWPQARQWLEKSLNHNSKTQGDSAAVLAYTYFHLAGVAQAEGQTNLSREYAQKSLALAERHQLADLRAEVEALLKQKR